MQAPSRQEQMTGPALRALLADGTLTGEWVLDPHKSSIRLKTSSLGLPVNGVFREVSGHGRVSAGGDVSGTLAAAAASIDTRRTRRDKHLRSAGIFDADNYPHITFTADGIRTSGPGVAVTGTLTFRGMTRPLSFDAAASVSGDGEIWLDAEVRVNRADFGIAWTGHRLASMNNTLTIHAVFARR
jgi:polyisoprenoid-binding protein YceI